jgi:hypothetical protein
VSRRRKGLKHCEAGFPKRPIAEDFAIETAVARKVTYEAMLRNGGLQAMFVQLRAFGHASARKALEKTGHKTLEAGLFKGLLEKVGAKVTKGSVGKAIPYAGALFGAGIDSYLMNRVLKGSNLFYHKRFLVEKAFRIEMVCQSSAVTSAKRRKRGKKHRSKVAEPSPKRRATRAANKRKSTSAGRKRQNLDETAVG